jgi:hypothetical protein
LRGSIWIAKANKPQDKFSRCQYSFICCSLLCSWLLLCCYVFRLTFLLKDSSFVLKPQLLSTQNWGMLIITSDIYLCYI